MCSVTFFPTLVNPVDFSFTARALSVALHPSTIADFSINVGTDTYRVSRQVARVVFTRIDHELNHNPSTSQIDLELPDPDYVFRCIPSLLAGNVITITESNSKFLNYVAVTLGNLELAKATEPFLHRYSESVLQPPTFCGKAISVFLSIFSLFSVPMRIVLFLCEVIGVAIAICFVFNLTLLPITSGILSPALSDVLKWSIMIPFLAFNANTVTIVELLVFYICKSNHFLAKTPIPKHVHLIKMFKTVWPCCAKPPGVNYSQLEFFTQEPDQAKPFQGKNRFSFFTAERNVWNVILGIVFFLALVGSLLIDNVYRYLLQFLAFYLPYFTTAVVCLLYSLHAILSLSSKARERFADFGDFSDPFLCAFYFKGNPWISGCIELSQIIEKRKALWSGTPILTPSRPIYIVLGSAIFSKFSIAIYVTIGLIVLLIEKHSFFTIGQSLSIGFVIILICFPIMTTISIPLLSISRWFNPSLSNAQVEMADQWMRTPEQRNEWLNLWFLWSHHSSCIRVARILWIIYVIIWFFLGIWATTEIQTAPTLSSSVHSRSFFSNITLVNPVCDLHYHDLDIVSLVVLAESAYITDDNDPTFDPMFRAFFGNDWRDYITEFVIKIEEKWWHSNLRYFNISTGFSNARVLSIRGTIDPLDLMCDAELWAGSLVIAALKATIPLFSGYADDSYKFIAYSMNLAHYMFKKLSLLDGYVSVILQTINQLEVEGDIILTGHSLGGALAKITGWLSGHQAVAFSGPGIAAIEAFYEWMDPNIPTSFVNVVPNLDPFASLDRASGSQFLIPCNAGALECHKIQRTQCMLGTVCGRFYEIAEWCNETFGMDEMQKMWEIGHPWQSS
jgi:hypothetical protein